MPVTPARMTAPLGPRKGRFRLNLTASNPPVGGISLLLMYRCMGESEGVFEKMESERTNGGELKAEWLVGDRQ